jgi:hypothetical protein
MPRRLATAQPARPEGSEPRSKYVVVGRARAGLQIGHFLLSAGRDFVSTDCSSNAAASLQQLHQFGWCLSNVLLVGINLMKMYIH